VNEPVEQINFTPCRLNNVYSLLGARDVSFDIKYSAPLLAFFVAIIYMSASAALLTSIE